MVHHGDDGNDADEKDKNQDKIVVVYGNLTTNEESTSTTDNIDIGAKLQKV